MKKVYKFKIGERVRVINIDGSLHKYYDNAYEYIGKESVVTGHDRWSAQRGCHYLLGISICYWFHEDNLEAVGKGFDAKDIIRKAFGLGG